MVDDVAGLLVFLAGLVLIFRVIFRGFPALALPQRGRPRKGMPSPGAFLAGGLVVVGLAQLALVPSDGVNPVTPFGAAVGVLAVFLTTGGWLRRVAAWAFTVLGAVASLPAVVSLVTAPECGTQLPLVARLASAAMLAVFAVVGVVVAVISGRTNSLMGLGWFGAVEVLAFLQTPGGLSILDLGGWSMVAGPLAAAVLGFLGARRPELVIGAATVAILVSQIGLAESGLGCAIMPGAAERAVALVAVPYVGTFAVVWLLTHWLLRR